MSGYDAFAIIILLVLAAGAVAVVLIVGVLPGYIAAGRRHPYAQAVRVAGGSPLYFLRSGRWLWYGRISICRAGSQRHNQSLMGQSPTSRISNPARGL